MYKYAVFQGGGVKGIALVGALQVAEEQGVSFEGVGGASAGAIVAALYAAGYTAAEMRLIFEAINFDEMLDGVGFARLALGKRLGLYRGRKFQRWLHGLLLRKGVRTFSDCKRNLRIVATDLTERTLVTLDMQTHPSMEVAEAIRMSMSIPFVFEPVQMGRSLMVDGGVLSNFPLSLFDGNETLGFRLHSKSTSVKFSAEGYKEYLVAIMGAMLDGRDNYDVQTKRLAGLIEIDPGSVSSTQFGLSDAEKADLYERGVSAGSKFFVEPANTSRTYHLSISGEAPVIGLTCPPEVGNDTEVRFSISALVSVKVDEQYLLVKGGRIDQFQPVGGVLKVYKSAHFNLANMGVKADSKIPIDQDSEDDLRVFVPRRSVEPFLRWFLEGRGREVYPGREFGEELVQGGILSSAAFSVPFFEYIGRRVEGIRWTNHFQCYEVLISEIYSLVPNDEQIRELRAVKGRGENPDVIWASPALIRARGYDAISKTQVARISEHSTWILDGVGD